MSSNSSPLESLPPFSQMMWHIFVANHRREDSDAHINSALEIIKSDTLNLFDFDNQLFRELRCGRCTEEQTKLLYNAIANYIIDKNIQLMRTDIVEVPNRDKTDTYKTKMRYIFIVNEPREDVDTAAGFSQVMKRIFTTREEVDTFMLSQTWQSDRLYNPERMVHPYTAFQIFFADDGAIHSEEELDYSAHAPPTPNGTGNVQPCSEYLKAKLKLATESSNPHN